MSSYLLINITLSMAALAINHYMPIPHRVRFYLLITAVIAWLIPFSLITIELPRQTLALLPVQISQLSEPILNNIAIVQSEFSMMTVIYTLLVLGLLRFLIDLIATLRHVQKLKQQSKPYLKQNNIRLTQDINGAFVSGYIKPIIWLDEQLIKSEMLSSVLTHEQQHIKSHDQYWLFIITLVQRLFWFNPLSLLLCHQCKKSIELSCDEACKKQLGQKRYQTHLAQLIIGQHQKTHALMNNQIHHNNGFNKHRIEQLEQENNMTKYQSIKLSFIVGSALVMSTYSLITVAHNTEMPELAENQILLELKIQKNQEEPKEIKLITSKGKIAHVTYDNHDFGFTPQVMPDEPTQIYTEIVINRIDQDGLTEIARPAIVTTNTQRGAFKFGDNDTYFDIEMMAKTNSDMAPLAEALDKYIELNDPIPAITDIPEVPSVPVEPQPVSAPKPTKQVSSPVPVSAPVPAPAPKTPKNTEADTIK